MSAKHAEGTTNEKIVAASWKAIRGELYGFQDKPGHCLAAVRSVLEHALGWPSHTLYADYLSDRVETPTADSPLRWTRNPHARDLERSLRNQGMSIRYGDMEPGDVLFNHRAAPYDPEGWAEAFPGVPFPAAPVPIGHVMVYLGEGMVLENINPKYRRYGFTRDNLSITPLDEYEVHQGEITTVIRFAPKEGG